MSSIINIYLGGSQWSQTTPTSDYYWRSITSNSTGQFLAVVVGGAVSGQIYISTTGLVDSYYQLL